MRTDKTYDCGFPHNNNNTVCIVRGHIFGRYRDCVRHLHTTHVCQECKGQYQGPKVSCRFSGHEEGCSRRETRKRPRQTMPAAQERSVRSQTVSEPTSPPSSLSQSSSTSTTSSTSSTYALSLEQLLHDPALADALHFLFIRSEEFKHFRQQRLAASLQAHPDQLPALDFDTYTDNDNTSILSMLNIDQQDTL